MLAGPTRVGVAIGPKSEQRTICHVLPTICCSLICVVLNVKSDYLINYPHSATRKDTKFLLWVWKYINWKGYGKYKKTKKTYSCINYRLSYASVFLYFTRASFSVRTSIWVDYLIFIPICLCHFSEQSAALNIFRTILTIFHFFSADCFSVRNLSI